MSRASREKGKAGEREVAQLLTAAGFTCARDGRGPGEQDLAHDCAGYHFEVKRRERLDLPGWIRQASDDAKEGETPVVWFRQSRQPWRAVIDGHRLARLLALEAHLSRDLEDDASAPADPASSTDPALPAARTARLARAEVVATASGLHPQPRGGLE